MASQKKKLLYICQYFNTPDEGGLLRPWEVSKYFKSKGYDVTVISAAPHHMSGRTDKTFQNKLFNSQMIEGIQLIKVFSYPNYKVNMLSRILYYTIYPLLAIIPAIKSRSPDVLITTTPSIFLLFTGFLISRLKKKDLIIEVRDAWLEFAIARNIVPKNLVRLLTAYQAFMFKQAKYIISVTPGIKKIVDEYTQEPNKNILVMNGYEKEVNVWSEENENKVKEFKARYNVNNKFVVLYTGTLSMARDTDIFGRTAKYLKDYPDIIFIFVGDGEKKHGLMEYCRVNKLKNSIFQPLLPRHVMPVFMSMADLGINAIRKNDGLESSLSNKIFDYLGNGLPVVWAGEGDTSEFIRECGGGIVVEPENEKEMGEAILKLYKNPNLKEKMGTDGKRYVLNNFTREKVMRNIDAIMI
jgi:glycosyltransferase involved in cell wall biosynthesis